MRIGNWQLDTVEGGEFWLDGGACFGVVPKTVWGKTYSCDKDNRIRLVNNCVLARDGRHTVLIDTGYGGKYPKVDRSAFALEDGCPILESLRRLNVEPESIDTLVLSHLHFDHAGGMTRYDGSRRLHLNFPNARHVIHRFEWEDAISQDSALVAAYPQNNLEPLIDSPQLSLVGDDETIVPGLIARRTGGHTRGHMAPSFESGGETAIYIGDICPTVQHVRPLWCLSYDTFLLVTRRMKQRMLENAARENAWVLWPHDPDTVVSRVELRKNKIHAVEAMGTLC